jgi:PAS domain S-box-containing protein
MKRHSIKKRFQIGVFCILLPLCATVSILIYYYLKDIVTADIYRETEIFIGTADATRTYVKEVLRPKVVELIPADSFFPHAMSTTFVGREIMDRLRDKFPEFKYKRAAINPMNPINMADDFELSMLKWFENHRDQREWHGLIRKNNRSYYTRLRSIYAESECLKCHGKPEDATMEMKAIYGIDGGYNYHVGDVVAADTVYIPVDVSFVRIKEAAWTVFLIAVPSLLALIGLFYLLFNRTVTSEMKRLLSRFQSISDDSPHIPSAKDIIPQADDEFERLREAFENVASNLKQAHDELKTSESNYRLLFEASQDAILILDDKTRLININEAGLKLFGFKNRAEALSIETFYQLFWDTRDAKSVFNTVQKIGFAQGHEVDMVDRMGKKLVIWLSATSRRDENNNFSGIDAMLRDVTEQRRIEKHLAQTEKLASIGQLASGVAHEINNPLGVIQCYSNLIAKSQPPGKQVRKDIEVIRKHTEQCKSVITALLNFARISEPQKTEMDIQTCVEDVLTVIEPQIKAEGISVRLYFPSNLPHLIIDGGKIKQVLMNLLLNALQAMPYKGDIYIRATVKEGKNLLAIQIADTGQGIAHKHIHRIFDPFFTTKDSGKGTGLGLSVSYGIVKQHGGEIEVESIPGEGSTFTVLLPLENSTADRRQPS